MDIFGQIMRRDFHIEDFENATRGIVGQINVAIGRQKTKKARSYLRKYTADQRSFVVSQTDSNGLTPLAAAACSTKESLLMTDYLVSECGACPNQPVTGPAAIEMDHFPGTPLTLAIRFGKNKTAKRLIQLGADIHGDIEGPKIYESPLTVACSVNNVAMVHHLVEAGINVNTIQSEAPNGCVGKKYTYLMKAVKHPEICKYLLDRGADINAKTELGRTAFHAAAAISATKTIELLIEKGAEFDWDDVIKYAAANGQRESVKILTSHHGHAMSEKSKGVKEENIVRELTRKVCDYFELLGTNSSLDIFEASFYSAKIHWEGAIKLRHENPDYLLVKVLPSETKDIYLNMKEPETIEDVQAMPRDVDVLNIYRLLILERVIGAESDEFLSVMKAVARIGARDDAVKSKRKLNMLLFGLQTMKDNPGLLINHGMDFIVEGLWIHSDMMDRDMAQQFMEAVVAVGTTLENYSKSNQLDGSWFYHSTMIYALGLVQHLMENHPDHDKNVVDGFRQLVRKMTSGEGDAWGFLHVFLTEACAWRIRKPPILKFLLECGLDIDERDNRGNTPLLHLVEHIEGLQEFTDYDDYKPMIDALIENGAHLDVRNDIGETFFDLIPEHWVDEYRDFRLQSLQCLTANTIVDNNIQYTELLPGQLVYFVDLHNSAPPNAEEDTPSNDSNGDNCNPDIPTDAKSDDTRPITEERRSSPGVTEEGSHDSNDGNSNPDDARPMTEESRSSPTEEGSRDSNGSNCNPDDARLMTEEIEERSLVFHGSNNDSGHSNYNNCNPDVPTDNKPDG